MLDERHTHKLQPNSLLSDCVMAALHRKKHQFPNIEDYSENSRLGQVTESSNCLQYAKKLPSEILDCTIAIPPYYEGVHEEQNSIECTSLRSNLSWSDHVKNQTNLLKELYRITKPGGHLWYISNVHHEGYDCYHPINWLIQTPWRVRQEIIWDKGSYSQVNPYRFLQKERRIFWLRKEPGPSFKLNSSVSRWGSIWFTPSKLGDPDEFPFYLVLAIIHAMNLPPGSLVFDPYGGLGTGTTAKACQVANQRCLIGELSKPSVKVITDRLQYTSDEDLYWISKFSKQIADETLDLSQIWDSLK